MKLYRSLDDLDLRRWNAAYKDTTPGSDYYVELEREGSGEFCPFMWHLTFGVYTKDDLRNCYVVSRLRIYGSPDLVPTETLREPATALIPDFPTGADPREIVCSYEEYLNGKPMGYRTKKSHLRAEIERGFRILNAIGLRPAQEPAIPQEQAA